MITQPMLATQAKSRDKLRFPVLATPKLDGIRCLKIRGAAMSRSFKPIRNPYIREQLERLCPDGLDGELMVVGERKLISFEEEGLAPAPETPFGLTSGTVMRMRDGIEGKVNFQYWVFDYVRDEQIETRYAERMRQLADLRLPSFCVKVLPVLCHDLAELDAFEEKCVQDGYEGAMIRDPNGPYKCGRSTEREGWLLKIKRFVDGEAQIVGFDELQHNENAATENAFGRTERKGGQAGLVAGGTLGALRVRDVKTGVEFGVGSGFDAALRAKIWADRSSYFGVIIVYKCQPYGVKDKPRFPIFKGFRHPDDM